MEKRRAALILMLILCSVLVAIPNILTVRASETIYIRTDGTVEGTDKIHRDGNIYAFTGDIFDSIVVEKDDITLDGMGYTLQGDGIGEGIRLDGRTNVTIKNVLVRDFEPCIYLDNSSNNEISGNNVINNGGGIGIRCSDSTIAGNNVTSNTGEGINIDGSNNTISGNYVADNKVGVTFEGSTTTNNLFYSNSFIDNDPNVQITSNYTESWDNGTVGNYWSNYNGTDNNGDGTGDTPYVIDENNRDNYPLMNPVDIKTIPYYSAPILSLVITATLTAIICKKRLPKNLSNQQKSIILGD